MDDNMNDCKYFTALFLYDVTAFLQHFIPNHVLFRGLLYCHKELTIVVKLMAICKNNTVK